ncbi:MAG TPA: hypothetical protein VKY26_05020 [Actinomycetota bacterium]|nr:hypothetical protein [Actinomycetota bacterium]
MNPDEHSNDSVLTRELCDALSELVTPGRPALTAIVDRGRAHQRRRHAGFAGLGVAGVAAATALALGLTGVLSATSAGSKAPIRTAAPGASSGPIQTVAFTLARNPNGTDTLSLTHSEMIDPAALQQALTQAGIPALVKTDTYCVSSPPPPDPVGAGVLSIQPPVGSVQASPVMVPAGSATPPADATWMIDHTVTVINPLALPAGAELFFGYFPGKASGLTNTNALFTGLIYTSSYTCSSGTAAGPPSP